MAAVNDRIALNQQALDNHLGTMEDCADSLSKLRTQILGLTFGSNGHRTSTGPAACRMAELTEQLAETVQQMDNIIKESVRHLNNIRADITAADSTGGGD